MWSVVQTESQREKVAAEFLRVGGFESYLPRIKVRKREAPLFPGYLFVAIDQQWWAIRWTIGVVKLLMTDGMPANVPDKIINGLKKREGDDGLVRLPKPRGLLKGDKVRVLRGSFAGHLGIYDGMSGDARVSVLLELLGRSVPVMMDKGDVTPTTPEVTTP